MSLVLESKVTMALFVIGMTCMVPAGKMISDIGDPCVSCSSFVEVGGAML